MAEKKGFSLAEALVTLLVVTIIIAVSAPTITKKSRQGSSVKGRYWRDIQHQYITPLDNRDILLGYVNGKFPLGVRIKGKLAFKNYSGHQTAWIKENGTSSFDVPAGMSMSFFGPEPGQCPDGWKFADGRGIVTTQYGKVRVPDMTNMLKIAEAMAVRGTTQDGEPNPMSDVPVPTVCIKCSPDMDCRYLKKSVRNDEE